MKVKLSVPFVSLAVAAFSLPSFAAQRAFVASTGLDTNPCTLGAPCRSFQTAHTSVDPGGEIVALDTAGYGALVISKSVTVMANPGVIAGIAVSTGVGVDIATGGVNVILRNLNINNVGTGLHGVRMTAGDSLAIEDCVVSQFGTGVRIEAAARVRVNNSLLRRNGTQMSITNGATADVVGSKFMSTNSSGFGFFVSGATGTTTSATVSDSVASGNFSGFVATTLGTGVVRLACTRCVAANNVQLGFLNAASDTGTALMQATHSTASGNGQSGFLNSALTNAFAHIQVGSSTASYNANFGFSTSASSGGTATFESLGNNMLHQNTSGPTSGTITVVSGF